MYDVLDVKSPHGCETIHTSNCHWYFSAILVSEFYELFSNCCLQELEFVKYESFKLIIGLIILPFSYQIYECLLIGTNDHHIQLIHSWYSMNSFRIFNPSHVSIPLYHFIIPLSISRCNGMCFPKKLCLVGFLDYILSTLFTFCVWNHFLHFCIF